MIADANADRCPVHGELTKLGGFSRQYQRVQQDAFSQLLRKVVGKRMYEKGGAGGEEWTEEQVAKVIR
ncbi:MAG: hypothetical protein KUG62_02825 [Rhodobacteraceae bacterium]|nr:hypothetical protein [Paracoccaceae bacterium]